MSARARQLRETYDRQLAELAEQLSRTDAITLERPCPERSRLGDGTVGAVAVATVDNYVRIAQFVAGLHDGGARHGQTHDASTVDRDVLLARLARGREAMARIGQLTDEQLDATPATGTMRFADGERTLEQVVVALFKHQRHQVDAIAAGLS